MAAEPGQLFLFDHPLSDASVLSAELRDQFTALARQHYTTDEDFPSAPQDGMPRVNAADANNVKWEVSLLGSWKTLLQQIQLGYPAPAKIIVRFDSPGTMVWTIDHNLGTQPLVQVFDETWVQRQAVPSAPGADQYILQHSTENRVIITHPGLAAGYAVIIG